MYCTMKLEGNVWSSCSMASGFEMYFILTTATTYDCDNLILNEWSWSGA